MVIRVRFSELDPYHHVNHAAYVTYLEAGRIEALEERGVRLFDLREEGLLLVATELRARFLRPALGGDRLRVRTRVEEVARVSSVWAQEILREEDVLVSSRLIGAVVDLDGRPRRIPPSLRKAMEALG